MMLTVLLQADLSRLPRRAGRQVQSACARQLTRHPLHLHLHLPIYPCLRNTLLYMSPGRLNINIIASSRRKNGSLPGPGTYMYSRPQTRSLLLFFVREVPDPGRFAPNLAVDALSCGPERALPSTPHRLDIVTEATWTEIPRCRGDLQDVPQGG